MYIDLLKSKAYKLFENTDGDLSWLLFLKGLLVENNSCFVSYFHIRYPIFYFFPTKWITATEKKKKKKGGGVCLRSYLFIILLHIEQKKCINFHIKSLLRRLFLTLSQTTPWFYMSVEQVSRKQLGRKENLLVTSNFSFSNSIFNTSGEFSTFFTKFGIVVCKLFQFIIFVVLEIVKGYFSFVTIAKISLCLIWYFSNDSWPV